MDEGRGLPQQSPDRPRESAARAHAPTPAGTPRQSDLSVGSTLRRSISASRSIFDSFGSTQSGLRPRKLDGFRRIGGVIGFAQTNENLHLFWQAVRDVNAK